MEKREMDSESLEKVAGGINYRSEFEPNYQHQLNEEVTIQYGTETVTAKITARGYFKTVIFKSYGYLGCYNFTTSSWNYGWWRENGSGFEMLPNNTVIHPYDGNA